MKIFKNIVVTLLLSNLVINSLLAAQSTETDKAAEKTNPDNIAYQKIIEEANNYLASLPENVRKEIETFRLNIAKINTEKNDVLKSLSPAARTVLKKTKEFKRKLPLNLRKEVGKSASDDHN